MKFYLNFSYLDLVVDASVDNGVNGCYIHSITSTPMNTYLKPTDFILSINNENMRKISNAQARAIIRRASLIGSDIRYIYQMFSSFYAEIFLCLVSFLFRVMKLNNSKIKHSIHNEYHLSKINLKQRIFMLFF
jgi:hypothetical protein